MNNAEMTPTVGSGQIVEPDADQGEHAHDQSHQTGDDRGDSGDEFHTDIVLPGWDRFDT